MNEDFLDIISVLSFCIGVMNLDLNAEQVKSLDQHLNSQDNILKNEQNIMIEKVIKQNEEIIDLLKELINAHKNY